MLYTFTNCENTYELYVAVLGASIFMAVACSIMVSLDRLLHVVKYLKASTRCAQICAAMLLLCASPLLFDSWSSLARDGLLNKTPPPSLPPMSVLDCKDYALHYPKVAVQLPMFNERAVCQAIIDAACELRWPAQRLKIQAIL
jgi:beta-mannan synthase